MITVTFIRHGESEDNLKDVWAGWKDAPLSDLGQRQAQAIGEAFSGTKIDYIYASPSLRAHATGKAVHAAQPHQPPFTSNPNLREQHFGIAEGHAWIYETPENLTMEELFKKNVFPVLYDRDAKFPEGESLDDLAHRAEEAIRECVLPHVHEDSAHIAIASHGLCISELIIAVLRLDPDSRQDVSYKGLLNTAWTRLTISGKGGRTGPVDPTKPPALDVHVTDVNNTAHLASLETLKNCEDTKQSEARAFFGGGLKNPSLTNGEVIADKN